MNSNLNDKQKQSVELDNKANSLILAGAGSGKTKVLTHRIVHLINNNTININNILALTFTNKAANEMRERLSKLLRSPINQGSWVGTFHSIAHKLLRLHCSSSGLKSNFQILDSQDQLRIIKRIAKEQDIDDKKFSAKKIASFINSNKEEGRKAANINAGHNFFVQKCLLVFENYQNYCENENLIDFADIMLKTYELLLNNPSVTQKYHQQFKYILVDEFQDTNTIQYKIIKLLKSPDNTVFCVGDDDQSIYGWRGAKVENIHNLSKDFAPLTLIKLEQNYRSTNNILSASNAVISNNSGRMKKSLWTDDANGDLIEIHKATNEKTEARFIASKITKLAEQGEELNNCAILYRSNALSRTIEESFIKNNISYVIYGGLRFFDRAEIKTAICYLRLCTNFNDSLAFERIVNFPTRGIGKNTIIAINQFANENSTSLFNASKQILQTLTSRANNALSGFITMIEKLSTQIQCLDLDKKIALIITDSGLLQNYENDSDKAGSKAQNIKELIGAAKDFINEDDTMSEVEAFLTMASLDSGELKNTTDSVQLMTIHSAKGLEFDNIFVIGMEEDLFPSRQSRDEAHLLREERRLCYVAMTRAKKKLTLSYADSRFLYGNYFNAIPSRFITEIPDEYSNKSQSTHKKISTYNEFNQDIKSNNEGFYTGAQVQHQKFGIGKITNYDNSGNIARVEVNFTKFGVKWLIVEYANLQVIST